MTRCASVPHLGHGETGAVSWSLHFSSLTLYEPLSKVFFSFLLFLFYFFCFGKVLGEKKPTHFPYGALPGGQPTPQLPRAATMHMHGPRRLSSHPRCDHSLSPNVPMSASPSTPSLTVCPQISTALSGLWISDAQSNRTSPHEYTSWWVWGDQGVGGVTTWPPAYSQRSLNLKLTLSPNIFIHKATAMHKRTKRRSCLPALNVSPLAGTHCLACAVNFLKNKSCNYFVNGNLHLRTLPPAIEHWKQNEVKRLWVAIIQLLLHTLFYQKFWSVIILP